MIRTKLASVFKRPIYFMFISATLFLSGCDDHSQLHTADLDQYALLSKTEQIQYCADFESSSRPSSPFVQFDLKKSLHSNEGISPLLADAQLRTSKSLNGEWQYLIDQLDMGDKGLTMQGGVGKGEIASNTQLIEYAFSDNNVLTVPGDWNTQLPSLEWYRGVIWYKKTFNYNPLEDVKSFLHFDGAYLKKDIYLNGELIARHDGGFTAFNVDISNHLQPSKNTLVVKVDSRSSPIGVPTEYNDWMNYGGLTRDVKIISVPNAHIQNYKIALDPNNSNRLSGWIQVAGSKSDINLNIPEANIDLTLTPNEKGLAQFSTEVNNLRLWHPNDPYRYKVNIAYGDDSVTRDMGFRTIKVENKKIMLNGEPIFLKGISMHEESMLKLGRANTKEDAFKTVEYLKDLNVNFVRLAHYQHNEYMIEALDQAGLLSWSELPIYHSMAYDNPCTLASAKRQYSEMIARDQNYASIIFWSISNETPISDARNQFLASLALHVRDLDDSRLITSALYGRKEEMKLVAENVGKIVLKETNRNGSLVKMVPSPDPVTIKLEDPLGEIVDVIGYNQYLGWYVSAVATRIMQQSDWDITETEFRTAMLQEMQRVRIESDFNKPIVISEFGAGAKQGHIGNEAHIWTEDLQDQIYKSQFQLLKNIPDLVGLSPWVLKDFRSPYRLNNHFQNYWNRKGLVSETGIKKKAFHTLSNFYSHIDKELVSYIANEAN